MDFQMRGGGASCFEEYVAIGCGTTINLFLHSLLLSISYFDCLSAWFDYCCAYCIAFILSIIVDQISC